MDPFENVRMFQLPTVDYGNPPLVLMIPFLAVQIPATTTTKVIFLILCITKRPTSLLTPDFLADYIEAAIKSNIKTSIKVEENVCCWGNCTKHFGVRAHG